MQNIEKIRRPEIFLAELLKKAARGQLFDSNSNVQTFFRAQVLAVDVEGGKLENPDGAGSLVALDGNSRREFVANIGPSNPRNSIKARVMNGGFDGFLSDDELRVFWPLFQSEHMSIPIKPGEYAYVMFEDSDFDHGLWVCRISGHEGANVARGIDSFGRTRSSATDAFSDSAGEDEILTDELAAGTIAVQSAMSSFEDV